MLTCQAKQLVVGKRHNKPQHTFAQLHPHITSYPHLLTEELHQPDAHQPLCRVGQQQAVLACC